MLRLTPEAINYIKNKQLDIYLDHPPLVGESSQLRIQIPSVKFGKPQNLSDFVVQNEEGITVYVPKGLEKTNITIELSGILFLKKLMARIDMAEKLSCC